MRAISLWMSVPLTVTVALGAIAAFFVPALIECCSIPLASPPAIQWYQILGCHLLHWSTEHLFWDLAMFCILGGCCERWWPKRYVFTIAVSAVLIPLAVMFWQPEISSYRGLSGIDTALFALMATRLAAEGWRRRDMSQAALFMMLLACLIAKVGYEFVTGDLLFVSEPNFVPLPLAHLMGGIVGTLVALAGFRLQAPNGGCNNDSTARWCESTRCCPLESHCEQVSTEFFRLGRRLAADPAGAGSRCEGRGTG